MATQSNQFDASTGSPGEHHEVPDLSNVKPEKPIDTNDYGAASKKRKTLKIMFLIYILITIGVIIGIAFAAYKSFKIGRPNTPTPTSTLKVTPTSIDTFTAIPSETSTPMPSETFTLQPSLTFTFNPYPMMLESPYPLLTENPYPISTDILITPEPPSVTITMTPAIPETEAQAISASDTPKIPTATFIYVPTKTPTRIKNPCPCSQDLYDCKDFSTHALAQACYDYCVSTGWGDAHHLDKGGSGIVCKGLP